MTKSPKIKQELLSKIKSNLAKKKLNKKKRTESDKSSSVNTDQKKEIKPKDVEQNHKEKKIEQTEQKKTNNIFQKTFSFIKSLFINNNKASSEIPDTKNQKTQTPANKTTPKTPQDEIKASDRERKTYAKETNHQKPDQTETHKKNQPKPKTNNQDEPQKQEQKASRFKELIKKNRSQVDSEGKDFKSKFAKSSKSVSEIASTKPKKEDKTKKLIKNKKKKSDLSNADKIRRGRKECLFLVRGKDKGRDAWHYVLVEKKLKEQFLSDIKKGSLDVADYGEVLKSGWGKDPSKEIKDEIDAMFE